MLSPFRVALGAFTWLAVFVALGLGLPAGSGAALEPEVPSALQGAPWALRAAPQLALPALPPQLHVEYVSLLNASRTPLAPALTDTPAKGQGLVRDEVLVELFVSVPVNDSIQDIVQETQFGLTADPSQCGDVSVHDGIDGVSPEAPPTAEAVDKDPTTRTRTVRRRLAITHNLTATRLYLCAARARAVFSDRTKDSDGRTSSSPASPPEIVWVHQGASAVIDLPLDVVNQVTEDARSPQPAAVSR